MILINSSPKETLKILEPFSRPIAPIGIGYIHAALSRYGIKSKIIDEQIEHHAIDLIREYIKEMEPPYIFGFSVLTATYRAAINLSKRLKELYPDSVVCFGGVHPTVIPEEVLSQKHIDIVIRGEGEKIMPELYSCIKEGKDFTRLNAISYKQNGNIIHNKEPIETEEDMDSLPSFPYHCFNPQRYDLGFVLSSRGCPYRCIFCSNRSAQGFKYRFRSAGILAEEIEFLHRKYQKKHIIFLDDNLVVNRERLYILLDEICKRGLENKVTFNFNARADSVDYKLLKDMFLVGFRSVFFGLETAEEKLMKTLRKGETVEQCIKAVRMAKQIGYRIIATFIYGLPGETHKDRMKCVRLSKELKLDLVKFNNATPYPGTALYDIAKKENQLRVHGLYENFITVSALVENPFKKIPFSYVPTGNTENEIRNDILFSHFAFYFDLTKVRNLFFVPTKGFMFEPGGSFIVALKKLFAFFLVIVVLSLKLTKLFLNVLMRRNTTITVAEFLSIFFGFKSMK